jgi:hypothetical protein
MIDFGVLLQVGRSGYGIGPDGKADEGLYIIFDLSSLGDVLRVTDFGLCPRIELPGDMYGFGWVSLRRG